MDDVVAVIVLFLEMRDVERLDGAQRLRQGRFGLGPAVRRPQILPDLPDRPEDSSTIEALPLAVFAEAHGLMLD